MAENGGSQIIEVPEVTPSKAAATGRPHGNPAAIPKGTDSFYVCGRELTRGIAITEAAKDKMCRNLYIYGYCKYEGKGCAFRHDRVCVARVSC